MSFFKALKTNNHTRVSSRKVTAPESSTRNQMLDSKIRTKTVRSRGEVREIKTKEVFFMEEEKTKEKIDAHIDENSKKHFTKQAPLHFLQILKSIALAISKLKNRSTYRTIEALVDKHYEIVNDRSYVYNSIARDEDHLALVLAKTNLLRNYYKMKIFMKKTIFYKATINSAMTFKTTLSRSIPVLSPDSLFKIVWDFLIIFVFLFLFLSYPIQISFKLPRLIISDYLPDSAFFSVEMLIAFIYAANIAIKLNQAFFDRGLLVTEKAKIIKNYIKHEILYDIFGSMPILMGVYFRYDTHSVMLNELQGFIEALIFCKIVEVSRKMRFLEETLHLNDNNFAILQLVKLAITIFLFSNIMACLWHFISFYPELNNQLKAQNYINKVWQSRYLRCLFWTVNPGRVDPQNDLEQFFGFFALLATSGSMGFMITGIHNLMRVIGKNSEQKKETIRKLNLYMEKKHIDYDLKGKVRKYVNYLQEINTADTEIEKNLISKLNPSLREEILFRANGSILKNLPFFVKNFSEKTLRQLVFALKSNRFYPEEVICEESEEEIPNKKNIYLIADGEVLISSGHSKIQLIKLKSGDMFGLPSIILDRGPIETVISLGFSSIYTIGFNEFISILKETPSDYEKFCLFRDKFRIENNLDCTFLKCYACNLKSHLVKRCPRIHYLPDRSFIIQRHIFSKPRSHRESMTRKGRKKYNSRKEMAETLRQSIKFNDDNDFDLDNDDDSDDYSDNEPVTYEIKNPSVSLDATIEEEEDEYDENEKEQIEINKDRKSKPKVSFMEVAELKPRRSKMSTILPFPEKGGFSDMLSPIHSHHDSRRMSSLPTVSPPHAGSVGGINMMAVMANELKRQSNNYHRLSRASIRVVPTMKEENNFSNIAQFENMNNYSIYYPEYNIESVIEKYNAYLEKKKNEKRRKKTLMNLTWIGSLANSANPNLEHGRAAFFENNAKQQAYRTTITMRKKKTIILENNNDITTKEENFRIEQNLPN